MCFPQFQNPFNVWANLCKHPQDLQGVTVVYVILVLQRKSRLDRREIYESYSSGMPYRWIHWLIDVNDIDEDDANKSCSCDILMMMVHLLMMVNAIHHEMMLMKDVVVIYWWWWFIYWWWWMLSITVTITSRWISIINHDH